MQEPTITSKESTYIVNFIGSYNYSSDCVVNIEKGITQLKDDWRLGRLTNKRVELRINQARMETFSAGSSVFLCRYSMENVVGAQVVEKDPPFDHLLAITTSPHDNLPGSIMFFNCGEGNKSHISSSIKATINQYAKESSKKFSSRMEMGETDEYFNERVLRDVDLVNHCLQEIETLYERLNEYTKALKKLNKSRVITNSKKLELKVKATLPAESELSDVFSKMKYCLNLLARLRSTLRKPNAPDLVRYLFTQFQFIVSVCGVERPAATLFPLLTKGALELVRNCLSSSEQELYVTLGPNWNCSKESPEFSLTYVPNYIPSFKDNWQPAKFPGDEYITDDYSIVLTIGGSRLDKGEPEYAVGSRSPSPSSSSSSSSSSSDQTFSSPSQNNSHSQSSSLSRPEYSKLETRNHSVPGLHDLPKETVAAGTPETLAPPGRLSSVSKEHRRVLVAFPYTAQNNLELSIHPGEIVTVLDDSKVWWLVLNSSNKQGYVPSTVLGVVSKDGVIEYEAPTLQDVTPTPFTQARRGSQNDGVRASSPPPPQPPVPPARASSIQTKIAPVIQPVVINKPISMSTAVQMLQAKRPEPPLLKPKPTAVVIGPPKTLDGSKRIAISDFPEAFIPLYYSSNSDDLLRWLKAMGYNESCQEMMKDMNASQLFRMTKEELVLKFGSDGVRIHNDLGLQQSNQNSLNELHMVIMNRWKKRIEQYNSVINSGETNTN